MTYNIFCLQHPVKIKWSLSASYSKAMFLVICLQVAYDCVFSNPYSFLVYSFLNYYFFTDNNGYDIFPARVLYPRNHTWSLPGISRESCLRLLFWNFTCFAAEFDADFSKCSLFCPPLLLLPESMELQWSTSNITSVVKTSSNSKLHVYIYFEFFLGFFSSKKKNMITQIELNLFNDVW